MKQTLILALIVATLIANGCAKQVATPGVTSSAVAASSAPAADNTADISADELKERLDGTYPPVVLDVRTEGEFKSGHIPGALNHTLGEIDGWSGELDKENEYVLVCASGARSSSAKKKLLANGFTHVRNMPGGMGSWKHETE